MLQNQFITTEELTSIHFQELFRPITNYKPPAQHASTTIIDRILFQLREGNTQFSAITKDSSSLMDGGVLTHSQKRLEVNRERNNQREKINQMLYGQNKNKQGQNESNVSQRLLSGAEHEMFMKKMKRENRKRKQERQKGERRKTERVMSLEEQRKKSSEVMRMEEIERKRESIKESLKKMRDNHDRMLVKETESRYIFKEIRKKKRLHHQMKQVQDAKVIQTAKLVQRRMLDHRQQSKLDFKELQEHQKKYIEWKKQNNLQKSRKKIENSHSRYVPPAHSNKLSKILQEQKKELKRRSDNKTKVEQKMQRITNYSSILKERLQTKVKSQRNKTVASDQDKTVNSDPVVIRQILDRTQIGNEYLKLARIKSKKRSKTEERYFNPEEATTIALKSHSQKVRVSTLGYIPEHKRNGYIQKMKRQQIEKIINSNNLSDFQKMQRLKIADQRISLDVRKKENELKIKYSTQASENALSMLLGAIRAKIKLINSFKGQN